MQLTAQALLQFLRDHRQLEGIDADTPLFSDGTVDSVGMIDLIGFIETTEGFEVSQADITIENFDTVSKLLEYVRSKVGE